MERIPSESEDTAFGVLKQLRLTLQLLASDVQDQADHFPPPYFFVFSEEMIDDFDHWANCTPTYWKLSHEQTTKLTALNEFLDRMSWQQDPCVGPDEALFTDPQWDEIRTLAKAALNAFGWPVEVPPPARWVKNALADGV
jgi:hypothetical protein